MIQRPYIDQLRLVTEFHSTVEIPPCGCGMPRRKQLASGYG